MIPIEVSLAKPPSDQPSVRILIPHELIACDLIHYISTEKPIVAVEEATEKDVDIAVAAARKAFNGEWRQTTPEQRGRYLVKLADLVERDAEQLAAIEALDNGKAISMANVDVSMVAGCLRYYGGWADKITGSVLDTNHEMFSYTRQEPVCVLPAFQDANCRLPNTFTDWGLWPDHSMELPTSYVGVEDRPRNRYW